MHRARHRAVFDEHRGRLSRRRHEYRFRPRLEMQRFPNDTVDQESLSRARVPRQNKYEIVGVEKPFLY